MSLHKNIMLLDKNTRLVSPHICCFMLLDKNTSCLTPNKLDSKLKHAGETETERVCVLVDSRLKTQA